MSSHLGLLEIECDAPSYPIVHSCGKLGFKSPEDVRWCRMSHRRDNHNWLRRLTSHTWGRWLGKSQPEQVICDCGHTLPVMDSYCFSFRTGTEVDIEMCQCPRCRTIYWERV